MDRKGEGLLVLESPIDIIITTCGANYRVHSPISRPTYIYSTVLGFSKTIPIVEKICILILFPFPTSPGTF